jgi:hypothetical protein
VDEPGHTRLWKILALGIRVRWCSSSSPGQCFAEQS